VLVAQRQPQQITPVIDERVIYILECLETRQHGRDASASAEARRRASGQTVKAERELS
jgi:hypothetical protein